MRRAPLFFALLASAAVAEASDTPLYAPAPAWVTPAPAVDTTKLNDASPQVLIYDNQQRMEGGTVTAYFDVATRATTTETLNQLGTVALPWMPDKGDLTIHRVEILRAGKAIDLLKAGERFTVLRREEGMEKLTLTGQLTATMAVKGLELGDTLRVAFSLTQTEPALKGQVASAGFTPAAPFRTQFGRLRTLWPAARKVAWRSYLEGVKPTESEAGGYRELLVTLPVVKQPEAAGDLPDRFQRLPILDLSSFADWADVSRTFAPLYATDGLIAPGSALAQEVTRLKAIADPLARTESALELVQDKIRYLAVAIDGGNLTPQTPARTWELRYGDCKAKTLMLLALLRGAGIEAEPVLASGQTRDLVTARLPGPGAFDHVLVRATVNGESLWLDGTGAGARLADIRDVPGFGHVLPLRAEGSALIPVPYAADRRPRRSIALTLDQRAGFDFPVVWDATVTIRGAAAQALNTALAQAQAEQKEAIVQQMLQNDLGDVQIARHTITYDPAEATAAITASGVATTRWERQDRRYRQTIDRAVGTIAFAPDRSRAAWRAIPVATGLPDSALMHVVVKLPSGIEGYTLEGDRTLATTIAGRRLTRTAQLAGGTVTLDDRVDLVEPEVAPAAIGAERAKLAAAKARLLRVVAPADLPTRAALVRAGRTDGRFKPIETALAQAIAAAADNPEDSSGYLSRASFRAGIYDYRGAIADLGKAIEVQETAELLSRRASYYEVLGEWKKAGADYAAAYALDPTMNDALANQGNMLAWQGDRTAAMKLLDERIALGDEGRLGAVATKGINQSLGGDSAAGVATIDAALAEKPADAFLLNMRCWVQGIGAQVKAAALADCTRSIEQGGGTSAIDSRAMVYFKLGRMAEALADANAALGDQPDAPGTLMLRAAIRARLGRTAQAAADHDEALLIRPAVEEEYRRFGVTL